MKTKERPGLRVKYYRDATNGWRWHVLAANNRILSASTEGYDRLRDCKANLRLTATALDNLLTFESMAHVPWGNP